MLVFFDDRKYAIKLYKHFHSEKMGEMKYSHFEEKNNSGFYELVIKKYLFISTILAGI